MQSLAPASLSQYYKSCFPVGAIYSWLGATDKREFAFQTQTHPCIRYLSYASAEHFRKAILDTCPLKIDIGCQYTSSPAKRIQTYAMVPERREFVLDVDIDAYDNVRICGCTKASVCSKCWPLLQAAMQVLHSILTTRLGFQKLLWFYSGRRGVHCWVFDDKAMVMNDAARAYAISMINNASWNESALAILEPAFTKIYIKQLDLLSDKNMAPVATRLGISSAIPLKDREEAVKSHRDYGKLVTHYMYPRLDVNVSKTRNHLLKCPFVVHPGTGRICVPIPTKDLATFVPEMAPTLEAVLKNPKIMKPHVDYFISMTTPSARLCPPEQPPSSARSPACNPPST